MTPAAGKAATLEAFLSLRKALSVCDEDLSRPDPSAAGSAWGWGRRSSGWGRRKRANGPFDPDAAALVRKAGVTVRVCSEVYGPVVCKDQLCTSLVGSVRTIRGLLLPFWSLHFTTRVVQTKL